MIYRHGFFFLNSDLQITYDISGNELRIVGDAYTLLLVLCQKRKVEMEELKELLGFKKDYKGGKMNADIEAVNHAIGKEVVIIEQIEGEFEEKTIVSLRGDIVTE